MLDLMHESSRRGYLQLMTGDPMTAAHIARMTGGSTDEVSALLQELENSGVFSRTESGVIYNRRMVRDESKRLKCADAGRKGGGNPTFKGPPKGQNKGPPKGEAKGAYVTENERVSQETQRKANGWSVWIDVNRLIGRNDPVTMGEDTAASARFWRICDGNIEELSRIYKAYLADRAPFIVQRGFELRHLAINKYRNAPVSQSAPQRFSSLPVTMGAEDEGFTR